MVNVGLEITSRCNMACSMCGHAVMQRAKADMPWERFVAVVKDIRDNGHHLRGIQWYGEPLIAERFIDAIEHLYQQDVPIRNAFYTNCMALTPEMTERMLAAGFAKVCGKTKKVWLGVDTLSMEAYAKLRIGGDLPTVLDNAHYFCERMRRRLPGLKVQRLLTRYNPHEPETLFVDLFGVPVATRKVGVHWDKTRDVTVKPFEGDRRAECRELSGTLFVAQSGRVTACCIDGELEQSCGHVDHQSLEGIYRSGRRPAQHKGLQAGDYERLPLCRRCTGSEARGRW